MFGACRLHGRYEKYKKLLVGKPERKRHLEDLGIDGKIVFEWMLRK
jgi:hypothetical protein